MRTTFTSIFMSAMLIPMMLSSLVAARQSPPRVTAETNPEAQDVREPASTPTSWPVIETKARRFAIDPASGSETQLTSPYRPGVLSPDGSALLSLGSVPGAQGFDLFVSDAVDDGKGSVKSSGTRRVTVIDGQLRGGQWMPDGKSVAFLYGGREDAGLYAVDVSAKDRIATPRRIDARDGAVHQFAVGSSGTIAYTVLRQRVGKVTHMDLVVVDGSTTEPILRDQYITAIAWSPDGSQLAYGLVNELRIRSMKDGTERILQYADMHDGLKNTASYSLAWNPDGSAILTAPRFVGGRMAGTVLFSDDKILIVPAGESGTRTLLKARDEIIGLSWIAARDVESNRATAEEAGVESPVRR